MNFYPFHIGDYTSHTRHLSLMEDLALRRCLDLYYLRERPLSGSPTEIARLIGMSEHVESVATILGEFFAQNASEWRNHRADIEIGKFESKRQKSREAGLASALSRRSTNVERTFNGRSTNVQPPIPVPRPVPVPSPGVPQGPSGPESPAVPSCCTGQQDGGKSESGPAGPEGPAGRERAALWRWLVGSSYRANAKNRHLELIQAASRLAEANVDVADLEKLAKKAKSRLGVRDPDRLFAHWIDHTDEALKELAKRL